MIYGEKDFFFQRFPAIFEPIKTYPVYFSEFYYFSFCGNEIRRKGYFLKQKSLRWLSIPDTST
jgi:hypothetical protein